MDEKSEFLGTENIRKLLFKLSTPVIIGLLVEALYNVVDTFFVGLAYGADSVQAIGGLSIAFPLQMIIMAFGIALGTGGASIISRALGTRDIKKAEMALGNVFSLNLIISVLIAIPCLLYLDPILKIFGATPGVLPYARDYLQIIIAGGIVFIFGISVQNLVRSEGNTRLAMNSMLIGAGLNAILAPIFIFSFGMGVQGAAIATVLSQSVSSVWILLYYLKGKGSVRFKSETLKPDLKISQEIGAIGLGSFVMDSSTNVVMILVFNAISSYGGDVAIAVFGVGMKIHSFVFLPLLGLSFGLQPIVGFNYGAKQFGRIIEAIKLSLAVTTAFGLFGLLIISIFPEQLLRFFSDDPEYLAIGKSAVMIIVLGAPLIGLNVIATSVFQALGQVKPSFLLSLSRDLLFLIPTVIILPHLYGLNGVWVAFPTSDCVSFLLSGILLFKVCRTFEEHTSSRPDAGLEMTDKRYHF
jgi:putative efflux protein, MATE family